MPFLNGYGKGTKEVLREWMNYAINDPPTWAQSVFPFLLSLYLENIIVVLEMVVT